MRIEGDKASASPPLWIRVIDANNYTGQSFVIEQGPVGPSNIHAD